MRKKGGFSLCLKNQKIKNRKQEYISLHGRVFCDVSI